MNQKLHHHQPVFNNITNTIKPIFWLFCRVQSSFELPTFWFDLYHHPVFLRISPCFIRKVINERFRRDHWLFGCKPQLEGTPAQRSETKGSCLHDSTTSGGDDDEEEEDDDDDDDDGKEWQRCRICFVWAAESKRYSSLCQGRCFVMPVVKVKLLMGKLQRASSHCFLPQAVEAFDRGIGSVDIQIVWWCTLPQIYLGTYWIHPKISQCSVESSLPTPSLDLFGRVYVN